MLQRANVAASPSKILAFRGEAMKLKEMELEEQVDCLKSIVRPGKNSLAGSLVIAAFKHHHIAERFEGTVKPLTRWYLGQLARSYIRKIFKEAKSDLENLVELGLLQATKNNGETDKEYCLDKDLYPALRKTLEDVMGKEQVEKIVEGTKFYRNPGRKRGQKRKA